MFFERLRRDTYEFFQDSQEQIFSAIFEFELAEQQVDGSGQVHQGVLGQLSVHQILPP